MKNHIVFFITAFFIIGNAVFWPALLTSRTVEPAGSAISVREILEKETRLVEHFCLSPYAPMPGRATIPAEWEKALKSKLKLRDNVGEIASEIPGLSARADDIRKLLPGQSVQFSTESKPIVHALIYRPNMAPNQLLLVAKSDEGLLDIRSRGSVSVVSLLLMSALAAAVSAFVITILRSRCPLKS